MVLWDQKNYIMGAGTQSGSDQESTDGIVDGHAYTHTHTLSLSLY